LEVPMSTDHRHEAYPSELPDITRQDLARFVKEARQRRAAEMNKLLRAAGRWVARLNRAALALATARARWPRERAYQTHT
jgi:CRISPR/Cas system-associated protein Csm6